MKLDDAGLDLIFREARTFNHYTDQPVTEADFHAIWDLLKMGPTSANQLPARMVWCLSPESKEKLAASASETNAPKIRNAPAAVVIGMDEDFHEHLPEFYRQADAKSWFDGNVEARKVSAFRNSSLQGAYFIIAARALGFDVGPMSGFDAGLVDKAFFADTPSVHANFIATIGYGDRAKLHSRNVRPAFDRFNTIA